MSSPSRLGDDTSLEIIISVPVGYQAYSGVLSDLCMAYVLRGAWRSILSRVDWVVALQDTVIINTMKIHVQLLYLVFASL